MTRSMGRGSYGEPGRGSNGRGGWAELPVSAEQGLQQGPFRHDRDHVDGHEVARLVDKEIRAADVKDREVIVGAEPGHLAEPHQSPRIHESGDLAFVRIPTRDERLRGHDAEAPFPFAESLQPVQSGIKQVAEEETLEVLRGRGRQHAEPVADHARDDVERSGKEAVAGTAGDFEDPVLGAVSEKIVFPPASVKATEGPGIDPKLPLFSEFSEDPDLAFAIHSESFSRPRLRSICRVFSSQDINRCEEKTLSASSRETKGITGRTVVVPSDTFGLSFSVHSG